MNRTVVLIYLHITTGNFTWKIGMTRVLEETSGLFCWEFPHAANWVMLLDSSDINISVLCRIWYTRRDVVERRTDLHYIQNKPQ